MTEWRMRLRDADRALGSPGSDLQPDTSQRIRRAVLAAVPAETRAVPIWSRTFAATAAALTLVCVGLLTALQGGNLADDSGARVEPPDPAVVAATDEIPATPRQQLQFSTPGGTRIIWVFDPGFEVKGTLP
jgi:hypothetical protein